MILVVTLEFGQVVSIAAGVLTVCGFLASGGFWLFKFGTRLGIIESKVGDMWGFIWRRAQAEAAKVGWGEFKSPFEIKIENVAEAVKMAPFFKDIAVFYDLVSKKFPKLSDPDKILLVESKFGDQILKDICLPLGVDQGACLVAVLGYAKAEMKKTVQGGPADAGSSSS